ncbi:MAG: zinc-ribbon domain-containing protein [Lachnospiraceae bacterium]|nr:zinc-ribbon domain-containing protein [Lachnospiraceae bacterium]
MIICGTRVFTKMLGYVNGIKVCQQCNHAGRFMVKREILWATLFWIPILPIWFQYYVVCPNCNMRYKVKRKEVFQLLSSPEQL